ncbi:MAG TPA: hypothetical protein VFW47_18395 [Phenylobacterium sp.]|nr:hypothetical protein [Phenylobacterium sp.]
MDRRQASLVLIAAVLAPSGAAHGSESGEKKKKTGGLSYLPLEAVTATIIRPDGRRGVLTVETGIDIPDPALHDRAEKLLPRVRAAFVQTVQIYGAGLTPGLPPNVEYLSRELQRQTDLALGARGGRLLLGTVMVN